jgi:mono/diheme cytochrome c family protein
LRIDAILLVSVSLLSAAAAADARQDYMLNCMGCHLADGSGSPPAIPRLQDQVGYFLTIPHGRAYLAQVPGAANSLLSDARLADVLNWIVEQYSGASAPADWQRYDAAEVGAYRNARPGDIDGLRKQLTAELERAHPVSGY